MSNGSNKLAWLIAGLALSALLNATLVGALVRSGADRADIKANTVKIDAVKTDVDKALPKIFSQLDGIQRDIDRLLKREAGG